MWLYEEQITLALLGKLDVMFKPHAPGPRSANRSNHVALGMQNLVVKGQSNRTYGVVDVKRSYSKFIRDITEDEVRRTGQDSLPMFLEWWEGKGNSVHPDDKIIVIEFHLMYMKPAGKHFLKSNNIPIPRQRRRG